MTTQIQLDGDSHEDANLVQFHGENTSGSSTALTKGASTVLALTANLISEPTSTVFDGTTVTIPVSGRYVIQYQLSFNFKLSVSPDGIRDSIIYRYRKFTHM